jgi:hypothetical protein
MIVLAILTVLGTLLLVCSIYTLLAVIGFRAWMREAITLDKQEE